MPRDYTAQPGLVLHHQVTLGCIVPVCTGTQYMQNYKRNIMKPRKKGPKKPRLPRRRFGMGGATNVDGFSQSFAPTSAPTAYGQAVAPGRILPGLRTGSNVTRISHAETFATLNAPSGGDGSFIVTSYPLQPGVGSVFPWLAQIAQRYETYKFRSLWFEFHTRVPTSQAGTVILAFDYDAQDDPPVDQLAALSYRDSVGDVTWRPLSLRLNLPEGDKLPTRYTRVGLPNGPFDLKTFDLGRLHVCIDGVIVESAGAVGLLEVHYVVDLFTPQIQDGVGGTIETASGLTLANLVGSVPVVDGAMPFSLNTGAPGAITFTQKWEGVITLNVTGVGLTGTTIGSDTAVSPVEAYSPTINTAGTSLTDTIIVRAQSGETLTPQVTGTSVSSVLWLVSEGPFNRTIP